MTAKSKGPAKKRGKKPTISAAKISAIVQGIDKGLPLGLACKCAGVSDRTLRSWRRRARDGEAHYQNVLTKLEVALATEAAKAMRDIEAGELSSGAFDWRAKAWTFERRFPELSKASLAQKQVDAEVMDLFEIMFEDEEATEEWRARTSRIWARVRGFEL